MKVERQRSVGDLVSLMPNAREGRIASNVLDIVAIENDLQRWTAAVETLKTFGDRAIAYYVSDFWDDGFRVRITFESGDVEPLLYFNRLLKMHLEISAVK